MSERRFSTATGLPPDARPVPGIAGYHLTPDGRLWSVRRKTVGEITQGVHGSGYRIVGVRPERGTGKMFQFYIHNLMLLTFVGPRPVGMQCCHNDGCRANNALSNLRWDTPRANAADKRRHGTLRTKLTADAVAVIRTTNTPANLIAARYGVRPRTVMDIRRGKNWAHVRVADE